MLFSLCRSVRGYIKEKQQKYPTSNNDKKGSRGIPITTEMGLFIYFVLFLMIPRTFSIITEIHEKGKRENIKKMIDLKSSSIRRHNNVQ